MARFFIFLFDDLNIWFEDLGRIRDAAGGHSKKSFSRSDHAAIETVSGRKAVEFTTDHDKLENAVSHQLRTFEYPARK